MDPQPTDFSLHVFRVLVRVRRTSKMTVCSPPALVASRTSFSLLGLIGIGLWHYSRVPIVLPERHTPYAVVRHSRPSALPQRCFRCITLLSHGQVRCRAPSDTVPSLAVDGSMSACHHSPTADKARQHPREGAWFMHGWASLIRCDPVRSAPMTHEHDRAPAAFRSST